MSALQETVVHNEVFIHMTSLDNEFNIPDFSIPHNQPPKYNLTRHCTNPLVDIEIGIPPPVYVRNSNNRLRITAEETWHPPPYFIEEEMESISTPSTFRRFLYCVVKLIALIVVMMTVAALIATITAQTSPASSFH